MKLVPEKTVEKATRAAMAGTIGIVAIIGWQFRGDLKKAEQCITNIKACLTPDFGINKDHPTQPSFKDFSKLSEKQTKTLSVETFGEGQIVIEGVGHLDYKNPNYFKQHVPFDDKADGTIFLDRKPITLTYEPCIVQADNYADEVLKTAGQNGAAIGQITLTGTHSPNGEPMVEVDAGAIAPCFTRMDVSAANADIYRVQGQMGNGHEATFHYDTQRISVAYAEASSCPDDILNLNGVQNAVATTARGYMASDPLWKQYAEAPIQVNFQDPSVEHSMLQTNLANVEHAIATEKHTLADSKGKTHPIKPAQFKDFAEVSCQVANIQTEVVPAP